MDTALITTYNRAEACLALLEVFTTAGFRIVVVDDASTTDYSQVHAFAEQNTNVIYRRMEQNGGKRGYCALVNAGLELVKPHVGRALWFLQDDLEFDAELIAKTKAAWEDISQRSRGSLLFSTPLDMHTDRECAPWSNKPMSALPDYPGVELCNYYDGSGIIARRALDAIRWSVKEPDAEWHERQEANGKAQSGFGASMTTQLVAQNYKMYRATTGHALARTLLLASQMHGEARVERTSAVAGATKYSAPVVCVAATIKSRRGIVGRMLDTIVHQVDRFVLHINDYEPSGSELAALAKYRTAADNEIELRFGPDYKDNAKFVLPDGVGVPGAHVYHFTVDDDILYPNDYVRRMVQQIETGERKQYVCVHGRAFGNNPKVRYLQTKGYHFGAALQQTTTVDLPGTGTGTYHTSALHFDGTTFGTVRMVDFEVAVRCAQAGVPVVCIARSSGWVQETKHAGPSIWQEVAQLDSAQTNMIRKHWPWPTYSGGSAGLVVPIVGDVKAPVRNPPQAPQRPVRAPREPALPPPAPSNPMVGLVKARKHESVLWPDWSVYDWKQWGPKVEDMLSHHAAALRGATVLDIGCGWGRWWPALERFGATSVRGLDTCSAVLDLRPHPDRVLWDGEAPLGAANVVFLHDVLRCMSDDQVVKLLRKVKVELPRAKIVAIERVGTPGSPYRTSSAWTILLGSFGLSLRHSVSVGRPGRRTSLHLFSS